MDPNQVPTPTAYQEPVPMIPTAQQQPLQQQPPILADPNKPSNKSSNMIIIVSAIVVLAIIGGGVYVWQDFQADISKRSDETKRKSLEQQLKNVETNPIVTQVVHNPTSRADTAKALANATVAQNVAEIYASENGHYPTFTTDFINGTEIVKLPSDIIPSISNPTAGNGKTTFRWEYVGDASAPTGGRITYWDYVNDNISTNIIYLGTGVPGATFVTPAY